MLTAGLRIAEFAAGHPLALVRTQTTTMGAKGIAFLTFPIAADPNGRIILNDGSQWNVQRPHMDYAGIDEDIARDTMVVKDPKGGHADRVRLVTKNWKWGWLRSPACVLRDSPDDSLLHALLKDAHEYCPVWTTTNSLNKWRNEIQGFVKEGERASLFAAGGDVHDLLSFAATSLGGEKPDRHAKEFLTKNGVSLSSKDQFLWGTRFRFDESSPTYFPGRIPAQASVGVQRAYGQLCSEYADVLLKSSTNGGTAEPMGACLLCPPGTTIGLTAELKDWPGRFHAKTNRAVLPGTALDPRLGESAALPLCSSHYSVASGGLGAIHNRLRDRLGGASVLIIPEAGHGIVRTQAAQDRIIANLRNAVFDLNESRLPTRQATLAGIDEPTFHAFDLFFLTASAHTDTVTGSAEGVPPSRLIALVNAAADAIADAKEQGIWTKPPNQTDRHWFAWFPEAFRAYEPERRGKPSGPPPGYNDLVRTFLSGGLGLGRAPVERLLGAVNERTRRYYRSGKDPRWPIHASVVAFTVLYKLNCFEVNPMNPKAGNDAQIHALYALGRMLAYQAHIQRGKRVSRNPRVLDSVNFQGMRPDALRRLLNRTASKIQANLGHMGNAQDDLGLAAEALTAPDADWRHPPALNVTAVLWGFAMWKKPESKEAKA